MTARTGRRAGNSGTRAKILDAARTQFARYGYDATTIRGIAAAAGVDPALVHHFHGTKEQLFVAAVGFPAVPSELLADVVRARPEAMGDALAGALLSLWETAEGSTRFTAIVRSALTNDVAMEMLRQFVTSTILDLIAGHIGAPDARYRASLVATQVVGLGLARYVVRLEPLASAPVEQVVAAVGPTLQRYLTGTLDS